MKYIVEFEEFRNNNRYFFCQIVNTHSKAKALFDKYNTPSNKMEYVKALCFYKGPPKKGAKI